MPEARAKKGRTEEEVAEEIEVEVKRPLQKIVPVRLSAEHWSELRQYARELGIGPTTLARMWIIERLALLRGGASGGSAPGAGLPRPRAGTVPLRLTLDEFMERLAGSLPDDEKLDILTTRRDSTVPLLPDKWEEVAAILMTPDSAEEIGRKFFRAVARSMDVQVVEEEAEASAREV